MILLPQKLGCFPNAKFFWFFPKSSLIFFQSNSIVYFQTQCPVTICVSSCNCRKSVDNVTALKPNMFPALYRLLRSDLTHNVLSKYPIVANSSHCALLEKQRAKSLSSRCLSHFTLDFWCTIQALLILCWWRHFVFFLRCVCLTMSLHNAKHYAKHIRRENSYNCAK